MKIWFKEWERGQLNVTITFEFYSHEDNNNNALNHDKMWASFLEALFKFGISSLVRLHNFEKFIFRHPVCLLFSSDVIYMIIWKLWVFYILCYIRLTWPWAPEVSNYSLYPVFQLSTELTLRKYWLNKWLHECLFSYRLSPTSEDYLF